MSGQEPAMTPNDIMFTPCTGELKCPRWWTPLFTPSRRGHVTRPFWVFDCLSVVFKYKATTKGVYRSKGKSRSESKMWLTKRGQCCLENSWASQHNAPAHLKSWDWKKLVCSGLIVQSAEVLRLLLWLILTICCPFYNMQASLNSVHLKTGGTESSGSKDTKCCRSELEKETPTSQHKNTRHWGTSSGCMRLPFLKKSLDRWSDNTTMLN